MISRRDFLRRGAALGALSVGAAAAGGGRGLAGALASAAKPKPLRRPGSLPHPHLPPGTDTLPKIEHILVLMMENHSYDNYFGLLGRGDGFRLDRQGRPTDANPDGQGNAVHAFRMPSTCQLPREPSQGWNESHIAYADGRNDGFVLASGPVAMGYWTPDDLPFYAALARTFVLCDRWFSSVLAKTYPNRRYLIAGTSAGLIVNTGAILAPSPAGGTIFEQLDAHRIRWKDYYANLPSAGLFRSGAANAENLAPIDRYYSDAAAGTLPSFALVEPDFSHTSEENPQNIQAGEAFAARVINAAMSGPAWPKTLLVWCYDEHGGYYDHVPPPPAPAPDAIAPQIQVPPDQPGAFDRYGFHVPAAVVSPYARRHYVSHVVHDHTSILKLVETKWNLPALTFRDANADDLLDCLDLRRRPAFLEPPTLPAPGLTSHPVACTPGQAGVIPPPGAVTRA